MLSLINSETETIFAIVNVQREWNLSLSVSEPYRRICSCTFFSYLRWYIVQHHFLSPNYKNFLLQFREMVFTPALRTMENVTFLANVTFLVVNFIFYSGTDYFVLRWDWFLITWLGSQEIFVNKKCNLCHWKTLHSPWFWLNLKPWLKLKLRQKHTPVEWSQYFDADYIRKRNIQCFSFFPFKHTECIIVVCLLIWRTL